MWHRGLLIRVLLCIGVVGLCLYSYVDTQNEVTKLRLEIPVLAKDIKDLKEKKTQLQYEIDLFESPEHLIEMARMSEFSHLKYPISKEILMVREGIALSPEITPETVSDPRTPLHPKVSLAASP